MRFADAQMAFPDIMLAIIMVAALGGSALNLIIVLGISRWMIYARIVFGLTRTLRQRPFIEPLPSMAVPYLHHPPAYHPADHSGADGCGHASGGADGAAGNGLSYLGLACPRRLPPGQYPRRRQQPPVHCAWIADLAGISIILLVFGINMFGNGLREHIDPRSQLAPR